MLLGAAWLLGTAVGARVGVRCLGPSHPGQPECALQAGLTSFPGACHKLSRAPADGRHVGLARGTPCLPPPPPPPASYSLLVSARPGQGATWPSCPSAGFCPPEERRGLLYFTVAPRSWLA